MCAVCVVYVQYIACVMFVCLCVYVHMCGVCLLRNVSAIRVIFKTKYLQFYTPNLHIHINIPHT